MTTTASSQARAARDKRLQSQFNITADEWDTILRYQGGRCALCKEKKAKTGKRKGQDKLLYTDHDHKTGLTRGILCYGCNRKLPEWLTIEWIEKLFDYFTDPPAVLALGERRYGRKGRVTNRRTTTRTKKRGKRAV